MNKAEIVERSIYCVLMYARDENYSTWKYLRDFCHLFLFWIGLWLGLDFTYLVDDDRSTGPWFIDELPHGQSVEYFGHPIFPIYFRAEYY